MREIGEGEGEGERGIVSFQKFPSVRCDHNRGLNPKERGEQLHIFMWIPIRKWFRILLIDSLGVNYNLTTLEPPAILQLRFTTANMLYFLSVFSCINF